MSLDETIFGWNCRVKLSSVLDEMVLDEMVWTKVFLDESVFG